MHLFSGCALHRRIVDLCGHKRRFHVFNCFFWKKLTEKSGSGDQNPYDAAFARVEKWTKVCGRVGI